MAEKNLRYFMRKPEEETVTVPAPESFVDEDGERLEMKLRILPVDETTKIMNSFKTKRIAVDKKGRPYNTASNEVIYKTDNDGIKAFNLLVAESLVSPSLKDEELRKFYNCYDDADMVFKVFSTAKDYEYISKVIMDLYGMNREADDSEDLVEEAKNS